MSYYQVDARRKVFVVPQKAFSGLLERVSVAEGILHSSILNEFQEDSRVPKWNINLEFQILRSSPQNKVFTQKNGRYGMMSEIISLFDGWTSLKNVAFSVAL